MASVNAEERLDILIKGGTILTMSDGAAVVEGGLIGIKGGRIVFVEPGRGQPLPEASEHIDATGCLVMPGLVNCHTHLPMVLFRGMADDLPLMTWLKEHIFPAEERYMDEEAVYRGSLLAAAEMILSGTTTFCDAYFHEGAVAKAALEAGMRGVVAQGFLDFPAPDQRDPCRHAAVADEFLSRWSNISPLLSPAIFAHSPYSCSPETLKALKGIARSRQSPFLLHLAETREELGILYQKYGKRPVQLLADLGILDEKTVAVHAVWLEETELDLLAQSGAKVVHCPESNMKLGAGVAPLPAMKARRIEVGLGTDGSASNNDLDLFGEMGMCAKVHKVFSGDPTVVKAREVVAMATIEGAKVLGLAARTGSLAAGKEADVIIVALDGPHLTPLYDPFSHLVYAAGRADVKASIIGGRLVMKDRRVLTIDVETAMEEVRRLAGRIGRERT